MKTFYFASVACPRTTASRRRLYRYLCANGLMQTKTLHAADFIVIDTCGYHSRTEMISVDYIRRALSEKKKSARVVAHGCLTKINPEKIRECGPVDTVSPPGYDGLDQLIGARIRYSEFAANQLSRKARAMIWFAKVRSLLLMKGELLFSVFNQPFYIRRGLTDLPEPSTPVENKAGKNCQASRAVFLPEKYKIKGVHDIVPAVGCLGNCTYCAIKFVWGRIKSRPIDEILSEMKTKLAEGCRAFAISAQDLGAYGTDNGTNIIQLLKGIFQIDGDYKVILSDFGPQWLIKYYDDLEAVLMRHSDKIIYFGVPVQSGSNQILRCMNRPYRIEDVKEKLDCLKAGIPKLLLGLQIMVGFPGERECDFRKTRDFLFSFKDKNPVLLVVTDFSIRPGIAAADMPGQVHPDILLERLCRIKDLAGQCHFLIGDVLPVLEDGLEQGVVPMLMSEGLPIEKAPAEASGLSTAMRP